MKLFSWKSVGINDIFIIQERFRRTSRRVSQFFLIYMNGFACRLQSKNLILFTKTEIPKTNNYFGYF